MDLTRRSALVLGAAAAAAFAPASASPSGPLDLLHLGQLSIYVGGSGTGSLLVERLAAYPSG